jgi:hypothetical protein
MLYEKNQEILGKSYDGKTEILDKNGEVIGCRIDDVDEFFDSIHRDYIKKPWILRRWWRLCGWLETARDNIKWFLQKLFTGHSNPHYWSAYTFIAEFALPLVRHLRKNHHGYPGSLKHGDDWIVILWQIEFALAWCHYEDDIFLTEYYKTEEGVEKVRKLDKFVQNGLDLFAKYFRNLWD